MVKTTLTVPYSRFEPLEIHGSKFTVQRGTRVSPGTQNAKLRHGILASGKTIETQKKLIRNRFGRNGLSTKLPRGELPSVKGMDSPSMKI